jgi:ABC-2 type transport system ATP-binding protein
MAVLTLENVAKKIGSRWIVEDLNMTVEPAEVYGFLGPNGAGKTTTIRMIVGLARPTKGVIRIDGHDVQRERAAALRNVGAIVENPETYKYLSGRENLIHYARLNGLDVGRRNRKIDEVVDIVGLTGRIHEKVKRYSLGMRQRLGVAQALLGDPKLLVLDEPTNGLDPAGMREFRELMRRLAQEGMSVFVSSHLLGEIQLMCDRVAIVKNGRVIAEERVNELVENAAGGIRIAVGQPEPAVAALQSAGRHASADRDGFIRVTAKRDEVPDVIRRLVNANIDIYGVEQGRDSLEEMFLQLTEEDAQSMQSAVSAAAGEGPANA